MISTKIPSWVERRAESLAWPKEAALQFAYDNAVMMYGSPLPIVDPQTTHRIRILERHLSLPGHLSHH